MKDQNLGAGSCFREILLLAIILVFSFFQPGGAAEPAVPGKTALKPSFALPCSSKGTCRELDSCADLDFGRCKGFKGVSGMRRILSGSLGTLDFRAQIVNTKSGKPVSLWHDVPLVVSNDEKALLGARMFSITSFRGCGHV
jgi:hypothetical protein